MNPAAALRPAPQPPPRPAPHSRGTRFGGRTLTLLTVLLLVMGGAASPDRARQTERPAPPLHVRGNVLADPDGRPVVLHGVNRVGGEYACIQGWGPWDGPMDDASVTAMRAWHVDAVRLPLNEDCWNGDPRIPAHLSGAAYARAVEDYVTVLERHGITPILALHWSSGRYTGPAAQCTADRAECLKPMPDQGAVRFWTSLARTFRDEAVLFDLYNEPHPDQALPPEQAWRCWRDGADACAGAGLDYTPVGMRDLVDAVRATGSRNVLLIAPPAWANDLTGWGTHPVTDPRHNLAAAWHAYPDSTCATEDCWNTTVRPVSRRIPVLATEIGEYDCAGTFQDILTPWLDRHATGYLAWAWNTGDCARRPSLIADFSGTPTPYGAAYRTHLHALHDTR